MWTKEDKVARAAPLVRVKAKVKFTRTPYAVTEDFHIRRVRHEFDITEHEWNCCQVARADGHWRSSMARWCNDKATVTDHLTSWKRFCIKAAKSSVRVNRTTYGTYVQTTKWERTSIYVTIGRTSNTLTHSMPLVHIHNVFGLDG